MKKAYISPELELIRFAPAERLADNSEEIDGSELMGGNGSGNATSDPNYDFGMPL